MDLLEKIRRFESMHIVFWLIKDSCWVLELKWMGLIMILPTVSLAIFLVYKTLKTNDFYINTAIFFWISANSYWMLMEFFNDDRYKSFAIIPFALGIIFVALFYVKTSQKREVQS